MTSLDHIIRLDRRFAFACALLVISLGLAALGVVPQSPVLGLDRRIDLIGEAKGQLDPQNQVLYVSQIAQAVGSA